MGKAEDLERLYGTNAAESVSATRKHAPKPGAVAPGFGQSAARMEGVRQKGGALLIPLARIAPDPRQPRREFDDEATARLAMSLKENGQLQSVRVRWDEAKGLYVLIAGERRWRAARLVGLPDLACVVADGSPTAAELLFAQMAENLSREDFAPLEEARGYKDLQDMTGDSAREIARKLGVDHNRIADRLALLDLAEPVQTAVATGQISASVAREIGRLGSPAKQVELAAAAVSQGLPRDQVKAAVRRIQGKPAKAKVSDGQTPATAEDRVWAVLKGGKEAGVVRSATLDGAWEKARGLYPRSSQITLRGPDGSYYLSPGVSLRKPDLPAEPIETRLSDGQTTPSTNPIWGVRVGGKLRHEIRPDHLEGAWAWARAKYPFETDLAIVGPDGVVYPGGIDFSGPVPAVPIEDPLSDCQTGPLPPLAWKFGVGGGWEVIVVQVADADPDIDEGQALRRAHAQWEKGKGRAAAPRDLPGQARLFEQQEGGDA